MLEIIAKFQKYRTNPPNPTSQCRLPPVGFANAIQLRVDDNIRSRIDDNVRSRFVMMIFDLIVGIR